MKKIIFFSVNMHIGGMEKALLDLLNELAQKDYSITLVLEQKEGCLLKQLDPRVHVDEYKMCTSGNILFRKIKNYLHRILWIWKNRGKYDFSCAYATYSVIGTRLALAASINSAIYIHSNYYDVYQGNREEIRSFFDNLLLDKFRHVLFVSEESKDALSKIYPMLLKKGIVINNLIDVEKIRKLSEEKIKFETGENIAYLFVGRLEEESKRLSRLLNAFSLAYNKNHKIRLFIIGEGKDYDLCIHLIHELHLEETVFMLGKKENPYPYIKAADCVLLTSDYEGYPVIYGECLILGTPVITTIPVSDGFVDMRKYAEIVEKREENIADAILNTDFEKLRNNKLDFTTINRKKIERFEQLFIDK